MKRLYRLIPILLILALLLSCVAVGGAEGVELPQLDDCFTERDLSGAWDATAVEILLTGDTAETRSHMVSVEGGAITILDGGTYVLSGALDDGSVTVDVDDDERVQLVLNGVTIACSDGPALRVLQADKVFVTLAEGTENALSSAGFAEEGVEAAIFSDEDLTFNGTGALTVSSPAGDGIDGKDDVKFASGTYVITAAGRGIEANDSIRIAGGDFTITSGGDALHASHGSNADLGYVAIWGGSLAITAGGGAANGAEHTDEMPFGGMMGGGMAAFPGFDSEDGEMPTQPDFDGEDGERPAMPDFSNMDGEMPDFSSMDGNMPTPPDFSNAKGEMPTLPDFSSEDGEMPTQPDINGDKDTGATDFTDQSSQTPLTGDSDSENDEATQDSESVSAKGIKASGDITILGGSFTFDTADDALHAGRDLVLFDGTLAIASGDDGMHAEAALTILGGTADIAQSCEGLEAKVITIAGGDISLIADDDGLNATDGVSGESFDAQEGVLIAISGGALYVNAEGDGIDSNGDLAISGGTVVVSGPENSMNGALDYNGAATISGGTVIAAGASGMAENFSEGSTQAAFLVSLSGEGGEITVTDSEGSVLLSGSVEKGFDTVVVSCPELTVGETYTASCGDASAEITLTDTVTGADSGAMGGGFRGGMPGFREGFDAGE